jgi:hypothetical protein
LVRTKGIYLIPLPYATETPVRESVRSAMVRMSAKPQENFRNSIKYCIRERIAWRI